MSVIGVAREIASLFNKKLNFKHTDLNIQDAKGKFEVEIIDKDTCEIVL